MVWIERIIPRPENITRRGLIIRALVVGGVGGFLLFKDKIFPPEPDPKEMASKTCLSEIGRKLLSVQEISTVAFQDGFNNDQSAWGFANFNTYESGNTKKESGKLLLLAQFDNTAYIDVGSPDEGYEDGRYPYILARFWNKNQAGDIVFEQQKRNGIVMVSSRITTPDLYQKNGISYNDLLSSLDERGGIDLSVMLGIHLSPESTLHVANMIKIAVFNQEDTADTLKYIHSAYDRRSNVREVTDSLQRRNPSKKGYKSNFQALFSFFAQQPLSFAA